MSKVKYRLKFYADSPGKTNYLHTFKIEKNDAKTALKRFENRGFKIRSAWFITLIGKEPLFSKRIK